MFDIGFPELLLVSVVMLLVFGPERLPEVLRSVGRFVGGARRSFEALRTELEREVGADEIRRELHNAKIMEDAKQLGDMVRAGRDEVEELLGNRYAALEKDGVLERREEDGAEGAGQEASEAGPEEASATTPDGASQLIPDEGTDTARADEETPDGEARASR